MIRRKPFDALPIVLIIAAMVLTACSSAVSTRALIQEHDQDPEPVYAEEFLTALYDLAPIPLGEGEKLRVVATTSVVADVVANLGGESIDLIVLIPPGADPHSFEPTPRDYQALTDAHVIFINGAGLEVFLYETLAQIADDVPVVSISEGIELRQFAEGAALDHDNEENEEKGEGEEHEGHHPDLDPHVWFDPFNVMIWAENAAHVMGTLDSANADLYEDSAHEYIEALEDLHLWIEEMVDLVPQQNRILVTDHMVFSYFAQRYGFEMLGAVIPAYSTAADPSAQELAALVDAIRALDVKAVFVGESANSKLAQRVAEDTGVALVPLYTGSLSEPGGPAATYLELFKYNVEAIVEALGR